jgi:hypothetical protein
MYKTTSKSRQKEINSGASIARRAVSGGEIVGFRRVWDADPMVRRLDAEAARVNEGLRGNDVAGRTPIYEHKLVPAPTKKRKGCDKRVYVARFVLKGRRDIQFLKIGISSLDLDARFQIDREKYEIIILAESEYFSNRDAMITEKSLHRAFKFSRKRPVVPLSSGNTECFSYSDETAQRMKDFVGQFKRAGHWVQFSLARKAR